ncbi:gp53-like domain-containing protein [Escherichia coli]|uniref:gp53-like domain-containing protein n=1 Tax=Escherichia coli TaxID=562 RepID=UPI0034A06CBD
MFHVDNSTGVPVMPQPSPVTSETELFFTEGGNGVPPTYPGPDWFNVIQSELLNILKAAGIDPDKMDNTQILVALKKLFLSRSNPFGDIKADGAAAIAAALTNLGLGEAATRNVGTGTGQVPDMSSFTTGHSGAADWPIPKSGWSKGPDGVITQWGIFGFPVGQTGTNVVFPLPFPAQVESITLTMADIQESLLSPTTMPAYGVNSTGTSRTGFTARMSGSGGFNLCYIAKGR